MCVKWRYEMSFVCILLHIYLTHEIFKLFYCCYTIIPFVVGYIINFSCFRDGFSHILQGWGYFPIFFSEWWLIHWLPVRQHVHIQQVSPQLSCGDTWQIWTWLKVFNLYFCYIKIHRNRKITERSFSNPHPCIWDNFMIDWGAVKKSLMIWAQSSLMCMD